LFYDDTVVFAAFISLFGAALGSALVFDSLEVFLEDCLEDFLPLRYLRPKFSFLLFSGFLIPMSVKASVIKLLLMTASNAASVAKDGERFTSINQGLKIKGSYNSLKTYLRLESNKMSYPSNSKQLAFFSNPTFLKLFITIESIESKLLIMMS
jgi:hypothetical protein